VIGAESPASAASWQEGGAFWFEADQGFVPVALVCTVLELAGVDEVSDEPGLARTADAAELAGERSSRLRPPRGLAVRGRGVSPRALTTICVPSPLGFLRID
jgi:hypothetical protein